MENGKTVAFYLDGSDLEKIETLKKALKLNNNSKLMRYLVHEKYHEFKTLTQGYDSDKQIFTKYHSTRNVNTRLLEKG